MAVAMEWFAIIVCYGAAFIVIVGILIMAAPTGATPLPALAPTYQVSVVLLNKAPLVISYGVLKESKVLFSANDNLRLDFEEKIIKQYLDFRYHLNIYDNEFISMIKSPEVT